jgi:hypothetical protein
MASAITDRALDLGIFALNYELESGRDYSDTKSHVFFDPSASTSKRSAITSPQHSSSKRMNATKTQAKTGFEPRTSSR